MIKRLTFFTLFFISSILDAQPNKRALVITIGDYPINISKNQIWSDLSSDNDRQLVLKQLRIQEFPSENIVSLSEKDATANNIRSVFKSLIENSNLGDMVYVHYSGHGQQVSDLTGNDGQNDLLLQDELDGFDEALVPYDAPFKSYEGYHMQNHIVDDELNYYFNKLKMKLGPNGQIIAVLDACHSGTATRGAETKKVRGTNQICYIQQRNSPSLKSTNSKINNRGLEMDFSFSPDASLANFIVFSGCKSNEENREYYYPPDQKWYGSLTYSLIQSWSELTVNSTYKDWYGRVNQFVTMEFNNAQHPEIEGNYLDVSVLNGTLVEHDLFVEINDIRESQIFLNSGQLNGLNMGDTIAFYPLEIKKTRDVAKPIAIGVISNSGPIEAIVDMISWKNNSSIKYNKYNLKGYVQSPVKLSQKLRVGIFFSDKKIKKQLVESLNINQNIEIVNEGAKVILRDTLISEKSKLIGIIASMANSGHLVQALPYKIIWNKFSYDTLRLYLENTLRIELFRAMILKSDNLDFEIKMQRILANNSDTLDVDLSFAKFRVYDRILLTLKNTGKKEIVFDILDIEPNNKVSKVDAISPIKICMDPLAPRKSRSIILGPIGPPYGLEQLKIVASSRPVDFNSVLDFGKSLSSSRGEIPNNPLFDNLDQSALPRSPMGVKPWSSICVKNIYFEITKE